MEKVFEFLIAVIKLLFIWVVKIAKYLLVLMLRFTAYISKVLAESLEKH